MKLLHPIAEEMVHALAAKSGPDSAASKVLAEADAIRAKGNKVRFWLTDPLGLCVQEGVDFFSSSSGDQEKS